MASSTQQDRRYSRLLLTNRALMLMVVGLCSWMYVKDNISTRKDDSSTPCENNGAVQSLSPSINMSVETVERETPKVTASQIARSQREIAEEEAGTTVLFKAASPSVVHITTHRVQRDFFSMNMYKIPRGSASWPIHCWKEPLTRQQSPRVDTNVRCAKTK